MSARSTGSWRRSCHAGFYYKTFMWPAEFWEKLYEPVIRRAAGLGRAGYEADPDAYEKVLAYCDVLVIGGGPPGLAAALAAGRAGADVIVADENAEAGGAFLCEDGARRRRTRARLRRFLARGARSAAQRAADDADHGLRLV